eukprot:495095-Hanusia_phi.AAC.1
MALSDMMYACACEQFPAIFGFSNHRIAFSSHPCVLCDHLRPIDAVLANLLQPSRKLCREGRPEGTSICSMKHPCFLAGSAEERGEEG